MKAGDKVRVSIDTNGGWHPMVGSKGSYTDIVRKVEGDQIILTYVSWVPRAQCSPALDDDVTVTLDGKSRTIRMLDRGTCWWAKLPGALEPLAIDKTYDGALRKAVSSLRG